jgi:subtilisin family serine protease
MSDYYWIADYGIDKLWKTGLNGNGVKVAVLDSGLALPHSGLNIDLNKYINVTEGSDKNIQDIRGHGTHCTGIIAASNNGDTTPGVAWGCDIYFCKITSNENGDDYSYLKKGLRWAIDKNVHIISLSQGDIDDDDKLHILIQEATEKNIFVVCSGGNNIKGFERTEIMYPAKYHETIAVGAVDRSKNIEKQTIVSSDLDILAPGDRIISTFLQNGYNEESGSSQAAAYVSGVLALAVQKYLDTGRVIPTVKDIIFSLRETGEITPASMSIPIINPISFIGRI